MVGAGAVRRLDPAGAGVAVEGAVFEAKHDGFEVAGVDVAQRQVQDLGVVFVVENFHPVGVVDVVEDVGDHPARGRTSAAVCVDGLNVDAEAQAFAVEGGGEVLGSDDHEAESADLAADGLVESSHESGPFRWGAVSV